jgi:hypothetical protein
MENQTVVALVPEVVAVGEERAHVYIVQRLILFCVASALEHIYTLVW